MIDISGNPTLMKWGIKFAKKETASAVIQYNPNSEDPAMAWWVSEYPYELGKMRAQGRTAEDAIMSFNTVALRQKGLRAKSFLYYQAEGV